MSITAPLVASEIKSINAPKISLKDFVKKYGKTKEFKEDLATINNYTDAGSVEEFFGKYQEIILGSDLVWYIYHDGEDSYTTASFGHKFPSGKHTSIEFNCFVDLDMKTAGEVYNCIMENYTEALAIKKHLV